MKTTPSWKTLLADEKKKPYFQSIIQYIDDAIAQGKTVYPPKSDIFNTFKLTPFAEVKVVILGQDPYHGPNQAEGLCFSVKDGVPHPPSLSNIFKAIAQDENKPIPESGSLKRWATQGVLLLNASLTVEAGKPQSHASIGWETFTDKVITLLSEHQDGLVFLLWGASAKKKEALIDEEKHIILTAPHPSPLSAHRGFFDTKHFSKTNNLLNTLGKKPIDW